MQSNQVSAAIVGVPQNKIDSKNTTSDSIKNFIKPISKVNNVINLNKFYNI